MSTSTDLPPKEVIHSRAWTSQSLQHQELAIIAFRTTLRIRESGWFLHQHPENLLRVEEGSTPFPSMSEAQKSAMQRVADKITTACAMLPQPELNLSHSPYPCAPDGGLYLPFPKDQQPPIEETFSSSTSPIFWRQIVSEMVSGWGDFQKGLSAGLVFLGPKDRLCYWPKLLNTFMLQLSVAYGNIADLFLVAAVAGVKIDLKSAFRSLRIHIDHAKFLGAVVNGLWIVFTRAPFGAAHCPAWFVNHLAITLARYQSALRDTIAALAAFVDDLGNSAVTIDLLIQSTDRLITALLSDGWWLSLSKAFLYPAIRMLYTGMIAEFDTGSIAITSGKAAKLSELLSVIRIPDSESLASSRELTNPLVSRAALRNIASSPGIYFLPVQDSAVFHEACTPCMWISWLAEDASGPEWRHRSLRITSSESMAQAISTNKTTNCYLVRSTAETMSSALQELPMHALRSKSLIIFLDEVRHHVPQTDWFDERDVLPPHVAINHRRPLPPRSSSRPAVRTPHHDLNLNPNEWSSLGRALGLLSWFTTCVPWLSHIRQPLDRLHTEAKWSRLAADTISFLVGLAPLLPHLRHQIRRPDDVWLTVIVDAAQLAWGSILSNPSTNESWAFAGRLPSRFATTSSTARETAGAVDATRAAFNTLIPFSATHYVTDSSALQGSATSSSSSEEVALCLRSMASWQAQGVKSKWTHERRSEGSHPLVDALSGALSPVPRWNLLPHVLSYLWDEFGGINVNWCADQSTSMCQRYVSNGIPSSERSSLLAAVPINRHLGWQGSIESYAPLKNDRAFAFPLWSELQLLWEAWSSRPFSLLLVAPSEPSGWWAPALSQFAQAASRTIQLRPRASMPPIELRSTNRDPRPLTAYFLGPILPALSTGRPKWWTPYRLTADGDIHPLPGPPKLSNPIIIPPSRGLADASAPMPRAVTARPDPQPVKAVPMSSSVMPHCPSGKGPIVIPPMRSAQVVAPHPAQPPQSSAPPPHPPVPAGRPATTVGEWARAMLAHLAGLNAGRPDAAVAPAHAPAIATAASVHALKANTGSAAPVRLAEMCLRFAEFRKVTDFPWSPAQTEAFVLDMIQLRFSPNPPLGWQQVHHAAQLRADASRIAELSRRAGFDLPPYCGSAIKAWTGHRGAEAKPEHSAAFPIHVSELLRIRPARSSPDYAAWSALFLLAIFCLRSGIVLHLYSDMFIPYNEGYLLVWRHAQKRTADDVLDIDSLSRVGSITAARHPELHYIINRSASNHRLFPNTTTSQLTLFVKTRITSCPPSFDVRQYGTRTAADNDAVLLQAVLFWWKRKQASMRAYYSANNIARAYAFSDRRSALIYNHITPGWADGRVPSRSMLDWDSPVIGTTLPEPPAFSAIAAAMYCVSESLALSRRTRCAARTKRARDLIDSNHEVVDILEGDCSGCGIHITPDDPGSVCMSCTALACTKCWPSLTTNFFCKLHNTK